MSIGTFDVVIGMDWLLEYGAETVCSKKLIRILRENGETIMVCGEKSKGNIVVI